MKYTYIILFALLITGCKKVAHIEFEGTAPGIKNGVFIVKTTGDSTMFGENVKDGKFHVAEKQLNSPGYYKMDITGDDTTDKHEPFEVYLENGKYTIETQAGKLYKYPKITSPSKIQEQLSAFYSSIDNMSAKTQQEFNSISRDLKVKYNSLSPEAYNKLLAKLSETESKMRGMNVAAFKQFLKQYPQSVISAHIMSKLDYESDPVAYYAIFKSLTPEAQKSEDGQQIGEKLSRMINLVAGKKAPVIQGKLPDGKPFDPKSIDKKLILVDFWKAGNELSRRNHDEIKSLLAQDVVMKNVAFVSVSLDSKSDWWISAVNDDNLTWTQVTDLKGDDSPNASNYNITEIPSYYLLDGQWNIVVPKIGIKSVEFEVSQYLKKQH